MLLQWLYCFVSFFVLMLSSSFFFVTPTKKLSKSRSATLSDSVPSAEPVILVIAAIPAIFAGNNDVGHRKIMPPQTACYIYTCIHSCANTQIQNTQYTNPFPSQTDCSNHFCDSPPIVYNIQKNWSNVVSVKRLLRALRVYCKCGHWANNLGCLPLWAFDHLFPEMKVQMQFVVWQIQIQIQHNTNTNIIRCLIASTQSVHQLTYWALY